MKYILLFVLLAGCANTAPAPFVRGEVFDYNDEIGTGLSVGVAWIPVPAERSAPVHDTGASFRSLEPSVGDLVPEESPDSDGDLESIPEWAASILDSTDALISRIEALEWEGAIEGERAQEPLIFEERLALLEGVLERTKPGDPPTSTEGWTAWIWQLPLTVILAFVLGSWLGPSVKQFITVRIVGEKK